jgi:Tfp pilus assembly protein PilO
VATVAVVAAALAYVWILEPPLERYARVNEDLAGLRASLAKMQANMQLRDRIERQYVSVRKMIHESGSPSQEMARFARLLGDLYAGLPVQTTSVRPLPDVQETYYRKFSLRMEVVGMLPDVGRFLAAIVQAPEPISVEWMELVCKDRPGYVTASMIVTKIAATQEAAAAASNGSGPATRRMP